MKFWSRKIEIVFFSKMNSNNLDCIYNFKKNFDAVDQAAVYMSSIHV